MDQRVKYAIYALLGFVVGVGTGVYLLNHITNKANIESYKANLFKANEAIEREDFVEAEGLLYVAIAKYPSGFSAYHSLGDIYSRKGDSKHALKMYNVALDKMNKNGTREVFWGAEKKIIQHDRQVVERKIEKLK